MKITSAPINDSIILSVSKMIDDSLTENKREPSHSELDFLFGQVKLQHVDPKSLGQTVGKYKRVRAVLNWAMENDNDAGERLLTKLIELIRGCGGFRQDSPNYVGKEAINNAISAFRSEGYDLSLNGELNSLVLDNLTEKDMTEALQAYVRRAKRGSMDAALLAGTGKDLLEAVAKHILLVKWGQTNTNNNFPFLLGQAFTALNLATSQAKAEPNESPMKRYERSLYELGCSVNAIRNKEGTGHGRPFLPNISQKEAANLIQSIGIVADYLLMKLKS
ncbi:abortive infection family protein [Brevibacillus sp. SYSU BS000544]|uniref:abortive infection family protein n=1 Tax=Brevibacillus sp. SYSU BS000544 TaxID=3416443 RepID=UPI003CE4C3AC